ncbi:4a-hydroxytetrahydrobiopterin dehydratase [Sphingomonas rhizophila]|uniref:4a-hydroxytetrahydrobiopterin dehydratase n=1 Tax=Sphingomonas rhizophila TaxID=2071607 RepID=A0A7G9SB31_9SPHN|nr:4a-hydroxytetrahydrobiopterin dehydratase [Sphingomonas rhizophila]QNN65056.1 4a-hydroxytetrahydrobiopterin dehydratase [Sphingomonas rhizophila]
MIDDIPSNWRRSVDGTAIERTLTFADFKAAFGFLTKLADHAEAVDHHPEFTSVWNRLDIRLTSHDAGGVTDRDVAMAHWIDEKFNPSGVHA